MKVNVHGQAFVPAPERARPDAGGALTRQPSAARNGVPQQLAAGPGRTAAGNSHADPAIAQHREDALRRLQLNQAGILAIRSARRQGCPALSVELDPEAMARATASGTAAIGMPTTIIEHRAKAWQKLEGTKAPRTRRDPDVAPTSRWSVDSDDDDTSRPSLPGTSPGPARPDTRAASNGPEEWSQVLHVRRVRIVRQSPERVNVAAAVGSASFEDGPASDSSAASGMIRTPRRPPVP
jgi:hypothetical protein